jgi:hypothetical protein
MTLARLSGRHMPTPSPHIRKRAARFGTGKMMRGLYRRWEKEKISHDLRKDAQSQAWPVNPAVRLKVGSIFCAWGIDRFQS